MRASIRWAAVAAICVFAVTVQAQSTTWHDNSFTDSTGRTLLYRLWVRSDWDLSRPRGVNLILHGNNRGTAEDARQGKWGVTEEAFDLGLAVVVPGSPFSLPEDLTFGERTLVGPSIGSGGTRFWSSHDARLIHEMLQSGLDGRLAIDYDKVVFTGASQGTCFLADFIEFYGGSYGGGFHAWCGCFWLDFDGDDSHDTFAIAPPFHASPWRPTFQWTPAATDAVSDRFSVFVEATTEDFLHPAAVSMSRYYSEWLGLRTATDLNTPGGHCHQGATPRSEIYNWLLSGAGPELPGSQGDTDGDGTPDVSDLDDDNDGAPDFIDAVPRDRQDWRDTDGDGIADARDRDADGDGVGNALDPFPLDSSERLDTDGDGIGNRLDGDDDNDGLPDARDPQPLVGTDDGRSLAFVRFSGSGPISDYNGLHTSARATVHAGRPADVVYPAAQGDAQHYQFLELGDSLDRRFEIMVDQFVRPESCRDVLLSPLCDVGRFSASGYYTTYFHNRFDRIWIDRNRNRDLTDDGPPLLVALSEDNWGARTTVAILEVPYAAGHVLPYAVSFTSNRLPDGLGYGGESVWKGKVVAPSGERVSVIVVDGNVDGLFDSEGDFICLDFDRNGWLNECDFSEDADGNLERPGALTPPFEWDGGRQRLSVAPSGHSVAWLTGDANPPPMPRPAVSVSAATPWSLTVTWNEPAGGPFTDYDVRYRTSGSGPYTAVPHDDGAARTATIAGLTPATAYEIEVRAVDDTGPGAWSEPAQGRTDSLLPGADGELTDGDLSVYYFPHLAVGAGWQTTLTYINYSEQDVTCQTHFLADDGGALTVPFPELPVADSRTDLLPPGGSVHAETGAPLSAPLAAGWAIAACSGPVKASLLFRQYDSAGVPLAEAGVNAAAAAASRFVTFAEQAAGQAGTGVAYANPSDTAAVVTFTAKDEAGRTLDSIDQTLMPGGHGAQNMAGLFSFPSFTGSLEITSSEPIVTLSINAEAAPIFSSLPPGELDLSAQGPTTYYFPHLAVGASWQTTLTYINHSPREVTCRTDFFSGQGTPLRVSFPGRGPDAGRSDVLPPGGSVHEETDVGLSAPLVSGWARADCTGPVKASLLFRQYDSAGVPTGEAGVNAAAAPATRFVTFAEKREGQPGTAVAYANPSGTSTAVVTFTAKDAAGRTLDSVDQTLMPRGHGAQNMAGLFSLTSFTGSLEITSTEPIVTLSLNAEAAPVFSSLPPGEVDAAEIPD